MKNRKIDTKDTIEKDILSQPIVMTVITSIITIEKINVLETTENKNLSKSKILFHIRRIFP